MSNRIEQVIGDIEEYIDGCKMQAFSNTKIVVDRPQIEEFLDELRQYTPEEVKKYQRMLNNRDRILADAKKKAEEIEAKAQAYADHMVSESQITKMAYDKANEILQDAKAQAEQTVGDAEIEANEIRQSAIAYTNDLLQNLESVISNTIDDCQNRYSSLLSSLVDHRNVVLGNISELNGMNVNDYEEEPAEEEKMDSNADAIVIPSFGASVADDEDDDED